MFDKVELHTPQKCVDLMFESEIYNTIEFNSATFNFSNHPERGEVIIISTPCDCFLITG